MKKFYNCFEKIMAINYCNLNDDQVKKIDFWINKFTPSIEFYNKTFPDFELHIINDYSKYDFIEHKNIATIIGKIEGIEANIGKYVSQIYQRLLINKGIIFVHASSVYKNDKGIIIIGDYGQGKTSVALGCILKDEEISLLSDNGIAIKDNKIIGYTKSISLRQVNNKMLSLFDNKKKFDYVNRTYFDYQVEKGKNIEISSIIIPHINAEDDNNYLVDENIAKFYLYEKLSSLIKGETLLFNGKFITKSYANKQNLKIIMNEIELLIKNIGLKYLSCSFEEIINNIINDFEVNLKTKKRQKF